MAQKKKTSKKKTSQGSVKKSIKKSTKKGSAVSKKTSKKAAKKRPAKKTPGNANRFSAPVVDETELEASGSYHPRYEDSEKFADFAVEEENARNVDDFEATEEQQRYATVLHNLSMFGLGFLVVAFFIYVLGILPSTVPPEEVQNYWKLSTGEYMEATGKLMGWAWLSQLQYGNNLSFASLAFLALVSIVSFLAILPIYFKKKEYAYGAIVAVQILVLVIAASGYITAGGH